MCTYMYKYDICLRCPLHGQGDRVVTADLVGGDLHGRDVEVAEAVPRGFQEYC